LYVYQSILVHLNIYVSVVVFRLLCCLACCSRKITGTRWVGGDVLAGIQDTGYSHLGAQDNTIQILSLTQEGVRGSGVGESSLGDDDSKLH